MAAKLVTQAEFKDILKSLDLPGFGGRPVAIGVSGGPDSMALACLIGALKMEAHVLIVDHGLREGSATEAKAAAAQLENFKTLKPFILKWTGKKPKTRLMEAARKARYRLMAAHCNKRRIPYLFLAHHAGDQFETVLFRFAKGSGLDGLAGMKVLQVYDQNLTLLRPFLGLEKDRLIATCQHYKIEPAIDPTNENSQFARPRLRAAKDILAAEGLTVKRVGITAMRLERARMALEKISHDLFIDLATIEKGGVSLDWTLVSSQPAEIVLRLLIKAIQTLRPDEDYLPRMEKIEVLMMDLLSKNSFRKRTLGGLVFERKDKAGILKISKEK